MTWKGAGGDQDIYWSQFDGTSWATQQRVNGVGTSTGPALAPDPPNAGYEYMAWKGAGDDQGIYWSQFDGTSWSPQQNISGVGTNARVAFAHI